MSFTFDMNTLILALAQLLFPVMVSGAVALYKHLLTRLPAAQQERVKSVVRTVVMAVEQQCSVMDGPSKKQEAVRMIDQLLAQAHLSVSPALLSALIEQAVYALNTGASPEVTQSVPAVKVQ